MPILRYSWEAGSLGYSVYIIKAHHGWGYCSRTTKCSSIHGYLGYLEYSWDGLRSTVIHGYQGYSVSEYPYTWNTLPILVYSWDSKPSDPDNMYLGHSVYPRIPLFCSKHDARESAIQVRYSSIPGYYRDSFLALRARVP